MYVLVAGLACRCRTTEFGREIHEFLLPGDVYVTGQTQAQPVENLLAITQCRAVPVRDETMHQTFEKSPRIVAAMLQLSLARETNLREAVCNIGRRPAARRIAYLLADLSLRLADCGGGPLKNGVLPLSQTLVADAVALSPVHVSRVLGNLKRRGLVDFQRGRIVVRNVAALRAFALSLSAPGGSADAETVRNLSR
jgi:CRP-like cAMP-binding protein